MLRNQSALPGDVLWCGSFPKKPGSPPPFQAKKARRPGVPMQKGYFGFRPFGMENSKGFRALLAGGYRKSMGISDAKGFFAVFRESGSGHSFPELHPCLPEFFLREGISTGQEFSPLQERRHCTTVRWKRRFPEEARNRRQKREPPERSPEPPRQRHKRSTR